MNRLPILLVLLMTSPLFAETAVVPGPDLPITPAESLNVVRQLASEGRLDEAIQLLTRLMNEAIPEAQAIRLQYDLANLLFLQGRYQEAREAYQKVITLGSEIDDLVLRSRERVASLKERKSGKRDKDSLVLIDIENALNSDRLPSSGSSIVLAGIISTGREDDRKKAQVLLDRFVQLKDRKARQLLDEARRIFDEEKDYGQVLSLLAVFERDFPDNEEIPSVRILALEAEKRNQRRTRSYVPSSQEER